MLLQAMQLMEISIHTQLLNLHHRRKSIFTFAFTLERRIFMYTSNASYLNNQGFRLKIGADEQLPDGK